MAKRKTTSQFIEDAIKVHGDRYDYSKVEYLGNNKDVIVICPMHGESKQRPANHLNNGGCFLCGVEKSTKSKLRSENEFIKKCKKIYGEDYDYSLVDYKTCKDKVKIICKTHGVFKVTGDVFLNNKSGCAKCTTDRKRTKNRSNFLDRATEIHGIKYDYSLVDYIKLTKLAKLYLIRIFNEEEEFYKIGKTKDTIKKRFSNTNIKPYNFEVVYFLEKESGEIFDLEIELHKKYNSYKYKPLNKFSGHTECYNLGLPIQEIINL